MSTRAEAKARGLDRYQGKPCPADHDGIRYTSNAVCVTCAKARPTWTARQTEENRLYMRHYRKQLRVAANFLDSLPPPKAAARPSDTILQSLKRNLDSCGAVELRQRLKIACTIIEAAYPAPSSREPRERVVWAAMAIG